MGAVGAEFVDEMLNSVVLQVVGIAVHVFVGGAFHDHLNVAGGGNEFGVVVVEGVVDVVVETDEKVVANLVGVGYLGGECAAHDGVYEVVEKVCFALEVFQFGGEGFYVGFAAKVVDDAGYFCKASLWQAAFSIVFYADFIECCHGCLFFGLRYVLF